MKTNKEKLEILRAAIEVLQEDIDDIDVVVVKTRSKGRGGRSQTLFNKNESKVRELHAQGYHNAGIAREMDIPRSTVNDWMTKMGLVSNQFSRNTPGYRSRTRTLSGTRMQQTVPRNLYTEIHKNEQ